MSVRKRAWTTSKGEQKEAWVVDYVDQTGKRQLKTFAKKKVADNFEATANVEIRAGIHTADSASITVAEAGKLWLETGEQAGLERTTIDAYRQHLAAPYRAVPWQYEAVAALGADGTRVRWIGSPAAICPRARPSLRSPAMVESAGLAVLFAERRTGAWSCLPQRCPRASQDRHRGAERRAERREKGRLKVGLDIPTREEIKAIVEAAKGRWRPILLTAIFCGLQSVRAAGGCAGRRRHRQAGAARPPARRSLQRHMGSPSPNPAKGPSR